MINVTVHGVCNEDNRNKLFLMNSEEYKKEKLSAIRKQRIQDVRQKSKEFAHKLRENVRKETENQKKRIEKTKAEELKNWRQQKLRETQERQHATLWDIGDAHKAAEAENLEQIEWEAQKQIASTRHGFRQKPKLTTHPNTPKKLVKISTCNIQQSVKKIKALGHNNHNKENLDAKFKCTDSKNHVYPNVNIEENGEMSFMSDDLTNNPLHKNRSMKTLINENENFMNESLISSNSSKNCNLEQRSIPSSYADFKELQRNGLLKNKCKTTPSIIMEIGSSDTSTSSLNIEDNHVKENKLFCRIYSKDSPKKSLYNPKEFEHNSFENRCETPFSNQTRFTQISNLIKQTSDEKYSEIDKNVKKITDINTKLLKIISSPKKTSDKPPENICRSKELFINKENSTSSKTNDIFRKDQCISSFQKTQLKKLSISPQKKNVNSPVSNTQKPIIDNKKKKQLFVNQKPTNKCVSQKLPNFCSAVKKPPIHTISTLTQKSPNLLKCSINKVKARTGNITTVSSKPMQRSKNSLSCNLNTCTSRAIGPSTKSIECQTSRVKFYDYNNKFSKEYDPNLRARITSEDTTLEHLNAMQNADIERQLETERQKETELLRQKSDERCQRALEHEKIRRDYENLQAKLDSLTIVAQPKQNINDEYLFSEARLRRQAEGRELKINTAVEDVLHKPVIITCPEIDSRSQYIGPKTNRFDERPELMNAINVADNANIDGLNNSDSCCSILLDYVENQSEQIKADINKCGTNSVKEKKLKSLLSRINILKSTLLDELKKFSKAHEIHSINEMIDSLSHLRKERENIMVISSEKKDLEKREKSLQKKEQILEKKIRQFYELKKNKRTSKNNRAQLINNDNDSSTETDSTTESVTIQKKSVRTNPIEILITVKNPKAYTKATKNSTNLDSEKQNIKINDHPKICKPVPEIENDPHDQQSEGSSTQYNDLPNTMCNTLDDVMAKCPKQVLKKQHGNRNSQRTSNDAANLNSNSQKKKISSKDQPASSILNEQKKNESNAQLFTYIPRLLGMSRQSIHMLGVSTSSVETPSLSVINSPANVSEFNEHNKERLEQLQSFINENYSFVSDLEESLKNDKGQSLSKNVKSEIWKNTLKKSTNIDEKKTLVLKPILKKPSPPTKSSKSANVIRTAVTAKRDGTKGTTIIDHLQQKTQINQINDSADINTTLKIPLEQEKNGHSLKNYIDSKDVSVQRIKELNDMIIQVRSEKQMLKERNLSLVNLSEAGIGSDPTTDYLDLPQKNLAGSSSDSTKISDSHLVEDGQIVADDIQYKSQDNLYQIIDEEQANLEKNKLTGISRDSGISLSRPVTALDNCDSPIVDTRREKLIESFEPFLKNIPKPVKIVHEEIRTSSAKGEYADNKIILNTKKQKPPTAITRYSPAEIAHELSTIIEIDTPATLQINASEQFEEQENTNKVVTMDPIFEIEKPLTETTRVNYDFVNFAEYSRENDQFDHGHADMTVYHHDSFHRFTQPIKTTLNTSHRSLHSDIEHLSKSSIVELGDSISRIELSGKKLSTAKEYFEKKLNEDILIDVAEQLLNSSTNSSVESLIDINTELKRRNMQLLPINVQPVSNKNDEKANAIKNILKQQDMNDLSGIDVLQSTKSKSSELEKDLDSMGMNWATRMLKKTKQTQALSSSSISTISRDNGKEKSRSKCCLKETSENSEALYDSDDSSISSYDKLNRIKQKFCLEELKRGSLSSNSLSDNSLVSLLIRSLMASPKSQKSPLSSGRLNKEKQHKTSTPKTSDTSTTFSANTKKNSLDTNLTKLFSGESRFSSVRLSDSSSDSKRN